MLSNETVITLKGDDSALVVRQKDGMEIYIPQQDNIDAPVKDPAMMIFKLALVFKDKDLQKAIDDKFYAMCDALEKENEEDCSTCPHSTTCK